MASFIFFDDYATALAELSDKSRLKVYDALSDYVFKQKEPDLHGESKAVFALIKREIDNYNKRVENGKKGGRKKSVVKPYLNQGSTTLVENKNQSSTTLDLREKENPIKEAPNKEKAGQKEINPQENIYTQEKEYDPPISPQTVGIRSDGQGENKAQADFFVLYPKIKVDNYSPSEYAGIDFELLIKRFEESEFLRGTHSFSWICKHYPKIAAGEYKDFEARRRTVRETAQNALGEEWNDLD